MKASYDAEAEVNCIAFTEGSVGKSMLIACGDDDHNIVIRDIHNGLKIAAFQMHRPVTCLGNYSFFSFFFLFFFVSISFFHFLIFFLSSLISIYSTRWW